MKHFNLTKTRYSAYLNKSIKFNKTKIQLKIIHINININGKEVERLRFTYSNPFATSINSKLYSRYLATKIPKEILDLT